MLENAEREIKNGQTRGTGSIGYTRWRQTRETGSIGYTRWRQTRETDSIGYTRWRQTRESSSCVPYAACSSGLSIFYFPFSIL
jgi:hypothetical protein